jgi:hypothetical protein
MMEQVVGVIAVVVVSGIVAAVAVLAAGYVLPLYTLQLD